MERDIQPGFVHSQEADRNAYVFEVAAPKSEEVLLQAFHLGLAPLTASPLQALPLGVA